MPIIAINQSITLFFFLSHFILPVLMGAISDNFDERIEQKIFHCEIVVDNAKVAAETKAYKKIPNIADFMDEYGNDTMQAAIDQNYNQIKEDVKQIVVDEMIRIEADPELSKLLKKE